MKKLLLTLLFLISGLEAQAQVLQLHFGGQYFFGHNRINLKQEIRKRFPNYPIHEASIHSVRVHSKSQFGNSNMVLTSFQNGAPRSSAPFFIPGNNWQFNQPGGFFPIFIYSPNPQSRGRVELAFNGPVSLFGIEVDIRSGHGGPTYPPTTPGLENPVRVGLKKAPKTSTDQFSFFPEWRKVGAVILKAHSNDVKVKHVRITFENGEVLVINQLRGYYDEQEEKTFNLNGRVIREISTRIRSANQIGRHGKIEVLVRYQKN